MRTIFFGLFCIVLSACLLAYAAEEEKAAPAAGEKAMAKPAAGTMSKAAKIKNAMSAAPMSIAKDATVMDWPEKEGGEMATLKEGTNGWTCLPSDPGTPSNDPMCLDKMGMEWGKAWMAHQDPKLATDGLGYMLQGGGSASNTDPFAVKPKEGEKWLKEPPHVMIFPAEGKLDATTYGTDPNTGKPWVMFAGTPYQHLMMPVR